MQKAPVIGCSRRLLSALIECAGHNLTTTPVEFHVLADGTNYMCTQRKEKNEAYVASDFYYSAVVVLVERGLLHGHIARSYKNAKDPAINGHWFEHSKNLAARVGLCETSTGTTVSRASLQNLKRLILCRAPRGEVNLEVPDALCTGANKHLTTYTGLMATSY